MRARPGFTLTELIVVMAIIAMLSGMLMGGVMVARRRGGVTRTKALIIWLDLAVKQYENAFGDYPAGSGGASSAEGLYRALSSPKWTDTQEFSEDEIADTDGNGRVEIIDHWRQPLNYYHHRSYSGRPRETSFRIVSDGPDGEEGTSDDVTNFRLR